MTSALPSLAARIHLWYWPNSISLLHPFEAYRTIFHYATDVELRACLARMVEKERKNRWARGPRAAVVPDDHEKFSVKLKEIFTGSPGS